MLLSHSEVKWELRPETSGNYVLNIPLQDCLKKFLELKRVEKELRILKVFFLATTEQ